MRQKNALRPFYEVAFLRSTLTAAAADLPPAHSRALGTHLVDVQLLELEARDQRRPALAGTPSGQLQELAGAAAAHLMHTRPSTALHCTFWPVMAACPPASQVPPRLRFSLAALLLMHYDQRPKTSLGAVFEAVL